MTASRLPNQRLESIDWLRGFVMVVMALDHVREYFHLGEGSSVGLDADLSLFLTRFVTHICAPTFVLLAGVSIGLMAQRKSKAELSRFLLTRGLWLIFLEVTVITFAWKFNLSNDPGIILQVIWAIGVAMVVLAGLIQFPRSVVVGIGIVIVAGHNLLDAVVPESGFPEEINAFWLSIHRWIFWDLGDIRVIIVYPILAWCGVMACGVGLASVFQWEVKRRFKFLMVLGGGLFGLYLLLRWSNLYGDPYPWQGRETAVKTMMSFFEVNKYPPSLLFLALTLGAALPLLALVERWRSPLHQALVTIGRVPLFYYVAHVYLIHLLAVVAGVLQGFPASALFVPDVFQPEGYGFGLVVVYLVWIGVVLALYPACRWFARMKSEKKTWWMSYL